MLLLFIVTVFFIVPPLAVLVISLCIGSGRISDEEEKRYGIRRS